MHKDTAETVSSAFDLFILVLFHRGHCHDVILTLTLVTLSGVIVTIAFALPVVVNGQVIWYA